MAYQTGTPTSPIDLIQKINTFLAANGWTSDKSATVGTGWETHLHKGSVYAHLRAAVGEGPWASQVDSLGTALLLYLSDGFDGSQLWAVQPTNAPFASGTSTRVGVGMNLSAGPFSNYYFFTDATNDNVVIVLEKSPGLYEFLAWGSSLTKVGSWTGGPYFLGSSSGYYAGNRSAAANTPGWTSTSDCPGCVDDEFSSAAAFVRCDSDSFTGKWIPISDVVSSGGPQGYTGRNGSSSALGSVAPTVSIPRYATSRFSPASSPQQFQFMQTSSIDGRVNLLPILWWVGRDGSTPTSGGFSLIGSLPTLFSSNGVGNGFVPAGEYTIGGNTYKMFPNFAVLKV
jgi:hypothetical protein